MPLIVFFSILIILTGRFWEARRSSGSRSKKEKAAGKNISAALVDLAVNTFSLKN